MDSLKMTILVDNNAADNLSAEHGFSLWVETDNKKILFDTGQGSAMKNNAAILGVDLTTADLLILSHGHYDHTGGLADLLHVNQGVHVYFHAAAFLPRYSVSNGIARPIKMTSDAMIAINSLPENRVHWVTKPVHLSESIGITGEIPRVTDYEDTGGSFYFDQDGKRADPIKDDLAFWLKTPKGLVICIGCCHAGIVNTLEYICQQSGENNIHTVIGGLHLLNADDTRLQKTVDALQKFNIENFIPCHCTGDAAIEYIAGKWHTRKGYAGLEIHI